MRGRRDQPRPGDRRVPRGAADGSMAHRYRRGPAAPRAAAQVHCTPGRPGHRPHGGRPHHRASAGAGDRKSTRLNSSHVAISYAVFCLKKKISKISILQLGVRIHEERPNHAKWYEMEENRRFDVEYTSILQSLATI